MILTRRARVAALAGLLCLLVAACGGGTPAVTISVTAPTSGAAVGVRMIEVTGTVDPTNSSVVVEGRRVRVRNGVWATPMHLSRATTAITITARAPGHAPASTTTTVHYGAATARALAETRAGRNAGKPASGYNVIQPNAPVTIPAGARAQFLIGCQAGGGSSAACACILHAVTSSPIFRTQATYLQFLVQATKANATDSDSAIPSSIRQELIAAMKPCIALQRQSAGGGLQSQSAGG